MTENGRKMKKYFEVFEKPAMKRFDSSAEPTTRQLLAKMIGERCLRKSMPSNPSLVACSVTASNVESWTFRELRQR